MVGIIKNCKFCKNIMQKIPKDTWKYHAVRLFCNKECLKALYAKFKNCRECGKTFQKIHRGIEKWSSQKYCSKSCANEVQKRKVNSLEVRRKMSKAKMGSFSHFWKGGFYRSKNKLIRDSFEYGLWRETVFKRDNYTCQFCGQRGGILNADHIKPFAFYPELRLEVSNGRTLCISCHKQTPTFGRSKKLISLTI